MTLKSRVAPDSIYGVLHRSWPTTVASSSAALPNPAARCGVNTIPHSRATPDVDDAETTLAYRRT